MTINLSPPCWLAHAWERGRDATELALFRNAVDLAGHYGEAQYARGSNRPALPREGDYFPPAETLGWGERAFVAIMIVALAVQLFTIAWHWFGLAPPTVAEICLLLATLVLLWSRRARLRPWIYRGTIRTVDEAHAYLRPFFRSKIRERLVVIGLDRRRRVVFVEIVDGTEQSVAVDLRSIEREALRSNAVIVLACHNHPSGDCRPSAGDLDFTRELTKHLRQIAVDVVDHIIVTEHEHYSFRNDCLL